MKIELHPGISRASADVKGPGSLPCRFRRRSNDYVLNVELGAGASFSTIFDHDEPLLIGAGDLGSNVRDFTNGLIDEVEIYNRALTDAEIKAIFDAGSAGKCNASETPVPSLSQWALVALAVALVGLTCRRRLAARRRLLSLRS